MAGNFLMEHNFAPRWTNPRQPRAPHAPHGDEAHRRMSLETLSRFLHAFQHSEDRASARYSETVKVHPLFDLIESPEDYKIYGELPGLTNDDLHIDVNDHLFTLAVSGEFKVPGEIAALQDTVSVTHRDAAGPAIKVEEEAKEGEASAEPAAKPEGEVKEEEPAKGKEPEEQGKEATPEAEEAVEDSPKVKYHIQERRIGKFKREFQFPVEVVVMESVKAQIKNGLLCITVPKHPTPPSERKKGRKLDVE